LVKSGCMHGPKTSKDWKRQKLPERLL